MRLATSGREREHAFIGRELCASVDRLPRLLLSLCTRRVSPSEVRTLVCVRACMRTCACCFDSVLVVAGWHTPPLHPCTISRELSLRAAGWRGAAGSDNEQLVGGPIPQLCSLFLCPKECLLVLC